LVKILKFFDADPKSWIVSDPGWKKFGSGINIPDPQHCTQGFRYGSALFLEAGSGFAFERKAGSGSGSVLKSKFRKFRGSKWCGGPWRLKMVAVTHHPDKKSMIWIRLRIKMNSWSRIRITKVMRIRNPGFPAN
jgi:hypothetical protein